MSAVSRRVTPVSRAAARMPRTPSRSTRLPNALQPIPTALTISPESPSGRYVIVTARAYVASSDPERVVPEHELRALLLGHLLPARERLEIVLARPARREHQQHRRATTTPEAVHPALRHVAEVAAARGDPRAPV